jgi:alpha/beta superfamily hydrolase
MVQVDGYRKGCFMEEAFFFDSLPLRLEGLYHPGRGRQGVVVTHPHPVYGGNMHNTVVASIVKVYRQKGYATLRFNFRGVGNSGGTHADGDGERDDVRAAVHWMAVNGIESLDLAGYSFGAWVNALTGGNFGPIRQLVMVSPPVAFTDFSSVGALPRLGLVVTGGEDEIAPAEEVQNALPVWNSSARFEVIPGTDHFYSGALDRLEAVIDARLPPVEPVPI